MLEKLLETLVRIAVALEKIANKEPATTITEKHEHNEDGTAIKNEAMAKKKEAIAKVEKIKEDLEAKVEAEKKAKPEAKKAETKKVAEDEVTFDQCKAAFLSLAKGLRDVHGVDKMKKITLGILNDFTGGQPLSAASLSEDQYADFLAAVELTLVDVVTDGVED